MELSACSWRRPCKVACCLCCFLVSFRGSLRCRRSRCALHLFRLRSGFEVQLLAQPWSRTPASFRNSAYFPCWSFSVLYFPPSGRPSYRCHPLSDWLNNCLLLLFSLDSLTCELLLMPYFNFSIFQIPWFLAVNCQGWWNYWIFFVICFIWLGWTMAAALFVLAGLSFFLLLNWKHCWYTQAALRCHLLSWDLPVLGIVEYRPAGCRSYLASSSACWSAGSEMVAYSFALYSALLVGLLYWWDSFASNAAGAVAYAFGFSHSCCIYCFVCFGCFECLHSSY